MIQHGKQLACRAATRGARQPKARAIAMALVIAVVVAAGMGTSWPARAGTAHQPGKGAGMAAGGRTLPRAARPGTEVSASRLSELLAELGYLPVSRRQRDLGGRRHAPVNLVSFRPADKIALAHGLPAGSLRVDQRYPAQLTSLWRPGRFNVILRGAVMAFESEHDMPVNGVAGPALWRALYRAAAAGKVNRGGYTYAIVRKRYPQTLTVWHDGRVVLRSLANTGIPASPTVDGTFPVYLRYRFQIMRGTNPDGRKYADPVWFAAYFHGGDAVHSYYRPSYGHPQSLGCVEVPYAAAQKAWTYLTYGTLVRVIG